MSVLSSLPATRWEGVFAIAFRDVFVDGADAPYLRRPLTVSCEGLSVYSAADGTHRFSVSGNPPVVPPGPYTVSVRDPSGAYLAPAPIVVAGPASTVQEATLWPTRRLRVPEGETAVAGQVRDLQGVPWPGLSVWIHEGVTPLPTAPSGWTDERGEFLVRLRDQSGAAEPDPVTLNVTVRDGLVDISVTPASVTIAPGATHTFTFQQI
ncbi:MAG: hypothetical protein KTR31_00490 [Myxococcales bacterium]|nr:hypothetical protein [Myxococcales bacterium]